MHDMMVKCQILSCQISTVSQMPCQIRYILILLNNNNRSTYKQTNKKGFKRICVKTNTHINEICVCIICTCMSLDKKQKQHQSSGWRGKFVCTSFTVCTVNSLNVLDLGSMTLSNLRLFFTPNEIIFDIFLMKNCWNTSICRKFSAFCFLYFFFHFWLNISWHQSFEILAEVSK